MLTKLTVLFIMLQQVQKYFDNSLINKVTPPKACTNWENLLNMEISWLEVFCQVRKIHDINFKWFQIKINNRILVTNRGHGCGCKQSVYFLQYRERHSYTIYGSVSRRRTSGLNLKGAWKKSVLNVKDSISRLLSFYLDMKKQNKTKPKNKTKNTHKKNTRGRLWLHPSGSDIFCLQMQNKQNSSHV